VDRIRASRSAALGSNHGVPEILDLDVTVFNQQLGLLRD